MPLGNSTMSLIYGIFSFISVDSCVLFWFPFKGNVDFLQLSNHSIVNASLFTTLDLLYI